MNIHRTFAVALVATIAIISASAPAWAQSKCDAGKLKEFGKKVFCLAKVDSKAAKSGVPIDVTKEAKCFSKFSTKCARAEQQGDCSAAVKNCADLMVEADACRAASVAPTTTTTSTTLPILCPLDNTACIAYRDVPACESCCNMHGTCDSECSDASDPFTQCISASSNNDCRNAVQLFGCAATCCP